MIRRLFYRILRSLGVAPVSESRKLVGEIMRLEARNDKMEASLRELEDENKALWLMIEENKQSSRLSPQTVDDFIEEVKETLMEEMLKDFDPVGEA